MKFRFMPEVHCKGMVIVENLDMIKEMTSTLDSLRNTDLGIQISDDGRVWICVNGVALLRFKPNNNLVVPKNPVEVLKEITKEAVKDTNLELDDESFDIANKYVEIDVEIEMWESIKNAASESDWIPKEHYFMNDWVADVCNFLRRTGKFNRKN